MPVQGYLEIPDMSGPKSTAMEPIEEALPKLVDLRNIGTNTQRVESTRIPIVDEQANTDWELQIAVNGTPARRSRQSAW